jgi:hypothetical protein
MKGKRASQGDGGTPQAYQLKLTLLGIKPPIWRRILMPGKMNLEDLHYVIQTVMGWDNSHLHLFELGGTEYSDPMFKLEEVEDERKVRLDKCGLRKGTSFLYRYDFGDSWEHQIKVEKVLTPEEKLTHPTCMAGERASPPEDCGGIWGYEELLEALSDPDHPDHEDMLEWVGGQFAPEAFDLEGVNKELQRHG